jgi:hypothetical protein
MAARPCARPCGRDAHTGQRRPSVRHDPGSGLALTCHTLSTSTASRVHRLAPTCRLRDTPLVNTNTSREAQLAEYEANNASYLHYDSFRWSAGSFLIAGVFLFCGSLLSGGSSQLFAPATGLVICVMTGWIYYAHRSTGVGGQLPASGGTARSVTGACPTRSRADRRLSPRCVLAAASTRACRRSAAVPSSRRYRTRHVGIFGRRDGGHVAPSWSRAPRAPVSLAAVGPSRRSTGLG